MKSIIYLFVILGLTTCKSTKFDSKAPFKISGATYNYWVGGQPGVSGIRVIINYSTSEDISFEKIYFQQKEGIIDIYKREGKTFLIGRINTSKTRKNDLILDIDSKKEVDNKLPKSKIPFKLTKNEAVISYVYKGKKSYYKIKNIKQTKSDFYP